MHACMHAGPSRFCRIFCTPTCASGRACAYAAAGDVLRAVEGTCAAAAMPCCSGTLKTANRSKLRPPAQACGRVPPPPHTGAAVRSENPNYICLLLIQRAAERRSSQRGTGAGSARATAAEAPRAAPPQARGSGLTPNPTSDWISSHPVEILLLHACSSWQNLTQLCPSFRWGREMGRARLQTDCVCGFNAWMRPSALSGGSGAYVMFGGRPPPCPCGEARKPLTGPHIGQLLSWHF